MKRPLPLKFIISLALLVYVFTGSFNATLWCIGEDGHFEAKISEEKLCDEATSSNAPVWGLPLGGTTVAELQSSDCCGACIDFYSSSFSASLTLENQQLISLPPPAPFSLPTFDQNQTYVTLAYPSAIHPNQTLLALRTIVLLI